MNAPALTLSPAPVTVADFEAFVRSLPDDPARNIGALLLCANVGRDEDLELVKRRLPRALVIAKAQITGRHWAANHTRVSAIEQVQKLMDEFEGVR